MNLDELVTNIKSWATELGFQKTGITDTDLHHAEKYLEQWLRNDYHGNMHYMQRHGSARSRPQTLLPGTLSVISVRMDYLPKDTQNIASVLEDGDAGFVSRYALGRDYHKLMRKRLQKLADRISQAVDNHHYRVFTDSAPVLEKALAEKAGLGWIGKHTNLIDQSNGSWFFLGEIYTNLPLSADQPERNHCGTCQACIDICPTQAIIAPYRLDARRCISYLTIELRESIPVEFRSLIGNRIYGCDDCQLVCPWNKFAQTSHEPDFASRHELDSPRLLDLWDWSENDFLKYTEGSAIRRIGYNCWQRNIAVALGNAPANQGIINALTKYLGKISVLVDEHISWAIEQQQTGLKQLSRND